MSETGKHLRIQDLGENVQGVRIFGDPARPEHAEIRVMFPGGSISVYRSDGGGSYWAHVDVQRPGGDPEEEIGRIVGVRLDGTDDSTRLADAQVDSLYRVSVRITRRQA